MPRVTIGIILKVVIFTGLLFVIYYFLFLSPKHQIPNALLDAEKILSTHYNKLIQNRLSYIGLSKLDASSSKFENERVEIIAEMQKTNEDGLKALNDPEQLKKVNGAPSGVLSFLNRDIANAYPTLLEKSKKVYEEQKLFIEKLSILDSTISKLFAYHPETDLGTLDPQKDKELLLERIASAKSGLDMIQENIQALGWKKKEVDKLIGEMNRTQVILTELETSLETNGNGQEKIETLYTQFGSLKSQALLAETSVIRSDESVKLLTKQTNLILEYEYWLGKINSFQEEI
jgi:hypothetical protein